MGSAAVIAAPRLVIAIEVARLALSSGTEHRRAPWRTRDRWLELRRDLQEQISGDAFFVLDDFWAQLEGAAERPPHLLIRAALRGAAEDPDGLRRLRSFVPSCLLELVAGRPTHRPATIDRLCDSHVHSGGAVRFEDVLDGLLVSSPSELLERSSKRVVRKLDLAGDPIQIAPLIVGLRLAVDHLSSADRSSPPLSWSPESIVELSRNFSEERYYEDAARWLTFRETNWTEVAAVIAAQAGHGEVLDFLFEALCLLQVALGTADVASLDIFVDDFERYPDITSSTFASGMGWLAPNLARLELRKTFPPMSRGAAEAQVLKKLREFLRDADVFPEVALQMPMGFLKKEWDSEGDPTRFNEQLSLAEGFVDAMKSCPPDARAIVSGLDVAGNERTQLNFVYVNAYNHFMAEAAGAGLETDSVVISAHAGESYEDPLGGLRAIDEFVSFVPGISRIGHALALDEVRSSEVYESSSQLRPKAALSLLDLCWARNRTIERGGAWPLASDRILEGVGQVVFRGVGDLTAGQLEAWYLSLFDLEIMVRHRERPCDAALPGARGAASVELSTNDKMTRALLYPNLRGGAARFDYDAWVDEPLAERVRDLRRALYPDLRDWLLDRMSSEQAPVLVEVCPTSNCRLGRYDLAEHPIAQFLRGGVECTISTDDPAIFSTTLDNEYESLASVLDTPTRAQLLSSSESWTAQALGQGGRWSYSAILSGMAKPLPGSR